MKFNQQPPFLNRRATENIRTLHGQGCFLPIGLGAGSRPTCPKPGLDLQLQHATPQLLLRTPPWASQSPFSSINRPSFPRNLWSGCLSLNQMPSSLPSAYLQRLKSPSEAQGRVLGSPLTPHVLLCCPPFPIHLLSWLSSSHGLCSYKPPPPHVPSYTAAYQFQAPAATGPLQMLFPLSGKHTHSILPPSPTQSSELISY